MAIKFMKFEEKWESEREEEDGAETWPSCFAGGQYVPSYKRAGIASVVPGWRKRPSSDTTVAVKRSGRS